MIVNDGVPQCFVHAQRVMMVLESGAAETGPRTLYNTMQQRQQVAPLQLGLQHVAASVPGVLRAAPGCAQPALLGHSLTQACAVTALAFTWSC